jgi:S-adenosylmethionine-dependent methyltransferase
VDQLNDLTGPGDPAKRLLPPDKEHRFRQALEAIYPHGLSDETAEVEIQSRHYWFRYRYLPWLTSEISLNGARVLEIGAGTGPSTVALAERGATVTSIDLNEASLAVAKLRAELHDVGHLVNVFTANATEIEPLFSGQQFDLIVYFAALEHMTYKERIKSLRSAWSMLSPGAHLSICDTPNRLWFHDGHTAFQNFFNWLPDEVAIDYASRTPRAGFNTDFVKREGDLVTKLARWGRGVSYHDFEIALDTNISELSIGGEWAFRRHADPAFAEWWIKTDAGRYHELLRTLAPNIPEAFLEEEIAVILTKPAT